MHTISFTVVIPTKNSELHISRCLQSILRQNYPKSCIEVIVSDNESVDKTLDIAKRNGVKTITINGPAPLVCQQRNVGAAKAKGDYLYFLDHDMELPVNFFQHVANQIRMKPFIDAWQVPEIVEGKDILLSRMKTFEKMSYGGTYIASARIIKREVFRKNGLRFEESLSGGPADWDMDLQLTKAKKQIDLLDTSVIHHEEALSIGQSIRKKKTYFDGIEKYKAKWRRKDRKLYNEVLIQQQFNPWYRLFSVFFTRKNWLNTVKQLHIYIVFLIYKTAMGLSFLK